jgi:Ca-activated chloride channel homolog
MVNYEVLVIEANQRLVTQGQEPLLVCYPADGLAIADSSLVYQRLLEVLSATRPKAPGG